jgi:hypothetical protein
VLRTDWVPWSVVINMENRPSAINCARRVASALKLESNAQATTARAYSSMLRAAMLLLGTAEPWFRQEPLCEVFGPATR